MILDAIYRILSTDATLIATVPVTQIHTGNAPEGTPNPCIIINLAGDEPIYTKEGASNLGYTQLEVDIFVTSKVTTAYTIADLVRDALDQFAAVQDGHDISPITYEGAESPIWDEERDEYQLPLGFRIREKS